MKIGKFNVGAGHAPFVIAEMSGNHNESLDRAMEIVEAAAQSGVHALKIQTYTADTMTLNIKSGEFVIHDPKSIWDGYSLYELYEKAHTPWEWHKPIFDRCHELGLLCFSTPFDATAVEFLEELEVPCYKIASFEIVDIPLIQKVAATGKPMIISTGMASLAEIDEAVRTARQAGAKDISLLKCTSSYPASSIDCNLRTLPHLQQMFGCEVGLSDHTLGVGVALASVALGATVIEKHLTLNRADGGVDAAFSLEPAEMTLLVSEAKRAQLALGAISYSPREKEQKSLQYRRSLYVVEDIAAGGVLTSENVKPIRPGRGLAPKYLEVVLGNKTTEAVKRGTPLSWKLFC